MIFSPHFGAGTSHERKNQDSAHLQGDGTQAVRQDVHSELYVLIDLAEHLGGTPATEVAFRTAYLPTHISTSI